MTVKTTLSFTDRHHLFLSEKVSEGVYATQSAAVALDGARPLSPPGDLSVSITRWSTPQQGLQAFCGGGA